jgi:DNA modification methylase
MNIQEYEISKVVPYKNNPRINVDAVNVVKKSLKEFGFQQPLVIDKDNKIVVGHTRLLAAKELGLKTVPCVVANDLSDEQIKAYRIMDNKSSEYASWNYGLLTKEVTDLLEADYDLNLTGFDEFELKDLGIDIDLGFVEEPEMDEDYVPEVKEDHITVLNDIWVLGNHKLLCGDSTNIDSISNLMGDRLGDMVFTDPPYNVDYEGRGKNKLGKIENDAMTKEDFKIFCKDFFATFNHFMKPLAAIYVCHPDSASDPKIIFETTFGSIFKKSSTIIWVKQSAGMGWQDYRAQHEPILYGWKEGKGKHFFIDARDKTTVWNIGRDSQQSYKHPTQKPVALSAEAIVNSSKGKDIVLDFFLGSGSTLIACEKTQRICYGVELDPRFCDVIIKRWQNYTGKDAIHLKTNKTYNELQKNTENGEQKT